MFNLPKAVLPLLLALPLLSSTSSAKAIEDRALPITATTTVVVEATVTETVYWIPGETRLSSAFPTASGTALSTPASIVLVAQPSQFVSARSSSASGYTRSGTATPSSNKPAPTSVVTSAAAAATTTSTAAAAGPTADSGRPMVAAYYPDWVSWQLSPEQINWSKFDWVDFGESHQHSFSQCEDAPR